MSQDLKDFTRQDGLDVVYSEIARERDGRGYDRSRFQDLHYANTCSFVEYETGADLDSAVAKIDGTEFKGSMVHAAADVRNNTFDEIVLTNTSHRFRLRLLVTASTTDPALLLVAAADTGVDTAAAAMTTMIVVDLLVHTARVDTAIGLLLAVTTTTLAIAVIVVTVDTAVPAVLPLLVIVALQVTTTHLVADTRTIRTAHPHLAEKLVESLVETTLEVAHPTALNPTAMAVPEVEVEVDTIVMEAVAPRPNAIGAREQEVAAATMVATSAEATGDYSFLFSPDMISCYASEPRLHV